MGQRVRKTLLEASEGLKKGDDPQSILTLLANQSSEIMRESGRLKDIDVTDWHERAKVLRDRLNNPEDSVLGIPSGISTIDSHFGGWQPGDFIVVMGWTGAGKALAHGTPVATPSGWFNIENINVGDEVIGSDGLATRVINKTYQGSRPIYRMTFSDGAYVDCDEDHLWTIYGHNDGRASMTLTTKQIIKRGLRYKNGQRNSFVPLVDKVQYAEKSLPIDPYTLGAILGDGCFRSKTPGFTTADPEIINYMNLPEGYFAKKQSSNDYGYSIFSERNNKPNYFALALKNLGLSHLKSKDKFIPRDYKFGSVDQRVSILRGLMDTDGTVSKSGHASFSSSSLKLIEDVSEIIRSLGGTTGWNGKPFGLKKTNKLAHYRISVRTDFNPFMIERKAKRWKRTSTSRSIVDIRYQGRQDATCIMVNAKDKLFVTKDYVVTHNSFITRLFAVNAWLEGYKPLIISLEMDKMQELYRIDTILNQGEVFRNSQLTHGKNIDPSNYESWAENVFQDSHPFHLITSDGVEVADQHFVQAKIEQYKPDLVILDYHTLFDDARRGGTETERAKNLSKDFKRIAVRNRVPVIDVSGVTMENGHAERPPELNEISWSKQLVFDSDLVLALHRAPDENLFQVVSRKTRRCPSFAFYLDWDLDTGVWQERFDQEFI